MDIDITNIKKLQETIEPLPVVWTSILLKSSFVNDLLSKINHRQSGFGTCDFDLFDKLLYALDNGKFFVFTTECCYLGFFKWVELYDTHCNEEECSQYKEDFYNHYKDKTNFSSFEELQKFMKEREKENGVFIKVQKKHHNDIYGEVKVCEFIVEE